MSTVDVSTKEIQLKVVYYGPGLGGKTSSLQYIHRAMKPDARGQLVSLATGNDRTLYFDFLPVKLPKLRGYTVRVQLYTVPGQVHYNSTRKLVLSGADAVIFVADSQRARHEANIESLNNLNQNLREQGLELARIPHLFQYNKRDVADVLAVSDLEAALNRLHAPFFETSASTGKGVFEALTSIITQVLTELRRRGTWRKDDAVLHGRPAARDAATGAVLGRDDAAEREANAPAATRDAAPFGEREASSPAFELRDEPSEPNLRSPTTDSIAASLQALAEQGQDDGLPALSPLSPEEIDPNFARGGTLSEILPPGPARNALVGVEYLVHRGDYVNAVLKAARLFNEGATSSAPATGHDGGALHALMLGIPGERFLRFRDTAARAASGAASSADALFAVFFLADVALRR